jgi:branched-chain amino acid transport system permease protein
MSFLTLLVAGLSNGSIYALFALGLVLLYKSQGIINFAQGEFLMAGGFAGYVCFAILHWPYWLSFLAAVAIGGVLGAVVERLVIRAIARQSHLALIMASLGLSIFIPGAFRLPFGKDIHTFPALFHRGPIEIGSIMIEPQSLVVVAVALLLMAAFLLFFAFTAIGKQMRATQQNQIGARVVGIDTNRIFSLSWVIAATIGAGAGVLAAPIALLHPEMGASYLLKGFAATVFGGLTSVLGAVIAGFLVGIIEMGVGAYLSTDLQEVAPFVIILIVLFIRPAGWFGGQTILRV